MTTKTTRKLLFTGCALLSSACIAFSLKALASTISPDTDNPEEIIIEESTAEEPTVDESTADILPQSDKGIKDEQ